MMNFISTIIKEGQHLICPSCHKEVIAPRDFTIDEEKKLVTCCYCGASVKAINLIKAGLE